MQLYLSGRAVFFPGLGRRRPNNSRCGAFPRTPAKDKLTPSYVLLDVFSADFIERSQAYLEYTTREYSPLTTPSVIGKMTFSL